MKKVFIGLLTIVLLNVHLHADIAYELGRMIGWSIVDSKTVAGYRDADGKKSNDFEGCDFGRQIIFTDNTALTCQTYSYTYSYRPTAVLLAKTFQYKGKSFTVFKMIVGDDIYDMSAVIQR